MKNNITEKRTLTTSEVKKMINVEFKDLPIYVNLVEFAEHCGYKANDCYKLFFSVILTIPKKTLKTFVLEPLPLCCNRGELFSWLEGLFHEAYEDLEVENLEDEALSELLEKARERCEELDNRYNRDFTLTSQ